MCIYIYINMNIIQGARHQGGAASHPCGRAREEASNAAVIIE